MYNQMQKERYIKYKESTTILAENFLETQFKFSESYEEELGKDLCNFNEAEIKEFYKARNFKSAQTVFNINSQLKEYTNWCNVEGLVKDHQNHYSFLTLEELRMCANNLKAKEGLITREELIVAISKLANVCDQYIFLAAFEGIKGKDFEDLLNVSCDDLSGNILRLHSGKEVAISEELKELIVESCNTYVYYSAQKELSLTGRYVIKERHNVSSRSTYQAGRRLYTNFFRLRDEIGLEYCTFNSIYLSGKYSYAKTLYDKEKEKRSELTLRQFVKEYKETIEQRYDKIPIIKNFVISLEEYLI